MHTILEDLVQNSDLEGQIFSYLISVSETFRLIHNPY